MRPTKPEPSKLLDKVKAFLPQIQHANQQLEDALKMGRNPDRYNIEIVDESQPYIEMNIGLMEESSSSDAEENNEKDITLDVNKTAGNSFERSSDSSSDSEETLTLISSSSLSSATKEQNTNVTNQTTLDTPKENCAISNLQTNNSQVTKTHEVRQNKKRKTLKSANEKRQHKKKPKIEEINKNQS